MSRNLCMSRSAVQQIPRSRPVIETIYIPRNYTTISDLCKAHYSYTVVYGLFHIFMLKYENTSTRLGDRTYTKKQPTTDTRLLRGEIMHSKRSRERTKRYHRTLAKRSYSVRRTKAITFERASQEVHLRATSLVSQAERSGKTTTRIPASQFEPYTTRFGKQMTTRLIREALPPYYVIGSQSTRDGGTFNGWLLTKIG